MAITYPLKLPGLDRAEIPLILEAPDLGLWQVKMTNDGVLQTTGGASGAKRTLKLKALDGGIWDVRVTNDGVLQTVSDSGSTSDFWRFVAPDEGSWLLTVTNDGVLQTATKSGDGIHAIGSVRFKPRAVVGIGFSRFTLQQQAQAHQGDIWAAELRLIPLDRDSAEAWIGTLLALNGREGTFLLGDPTGELPRGTAKGTPLVNGASQTGKTLVTDGWTASSLKILKRGDWIQLGSGSTQRIYRIVKDVDSDGSGNATLDIWPRLRESPADNEALKLSFTEGVFRLAENEMPWDIDSANRYGIEVDVVEAT